MDPRVKTLWLDRIDQELMDDWFVLATNQLRRDNNSFSILGLLCDLFVQDTWEGEWIPQNTPQDSGYVSFIFKVGEGPGSIAFSNLPEVVMKWAGLMQSDPQLNGQDTFRWSRKGTTLDMFRVLIEYYL